MISETKLTYNSEDPIFILEDQQHNLDRIRHNIQELGFKNDTITANSYNQAVRTVVEHIQTGENFYRLIFDRMVPQFSDDPYDIRPKAGLYAASSVIHEYEYTELVQPPIAIWTTFEKNEMPPETFGELLQQEGIIHLEKKYSLANLEKFLNE